MAARSVVFITLALFLGIAALTLHLLAICSPHWKITKRDVPPTMGPVSYGIWERCEHMNLSITKQGIALGVQSGVQVCRPNLFMRYSPDKFYACYSIRRQCAVLEKDQLPEGCSCRRLSYTRGLQWLIILAAVFIVLGLLLLYLRVITSPENNSAAILLSYGPFICFLLALLLMTTGLILIFAYLRRDTYEDYSFPLSTIPIDTDSIKTHDLHSLRNYAKHFADRFSHERYLAAERELRDDANTHFHTIIGRASIYEIIATGLIFIVTALTFWLGIKLRSEDI